uniref:NLR family pyrin domain containing 11 n=1 Tax=Molossus molossus TaxID=27622 RepID=A0A7J8C9R6_MOLMO|nr:NLR family pyrin domain containing 11 [Molossus molossus]
MTESGSYEFDLLWYLEKLNKRDFQNLKNHLAQECLEIGPPPIPRFDVSKTKADLVNLLTTSYEAQHVWNIMYNVLHKIQRKDLCEKINARRSCNKETYKIFMKKKFLPQWERCLYNDVHNEFCKEMITEIIDKLDCAFNPTNTESAKVLNAFLVGQTAAGKTMVLRRAMFEWANGKIWKNMFSYVVYITSHEINQMANSSLVELISKDWPDGQPPTADILSDPQKILFVLEDLDNVEINLNLNTSALCGDSREQIPVSVLLASLLTRKMAPGCSFLISSRPDAAAATWALMKKTDTLLTLPFSCEMKQKYFTLFFKDSQRAMTAFKFVQENEIFMHLCQVPILCWITCISLNRQMDKGDDLKHSCQTLTDIYAHFLADTLASEAANQYALVLLQRLCSLALEGLLHDTLHFTEEDLRSVGFTMADVSTLQTLKILLPSNNRKDHYTFTHLKLQEFCAAVAFMMELTESQIPSARESCKEKRERYTDFSPVITSIFGLLNEKRRQTLETALGCHLLTRNIRQYLLQEMKCFGNNLKPIGHHTPLFYCLFENQEEEFVKQVMDSFLEATIYVQNNGDLMVSSYCLGYCHPLQKLKLGIRHIFENKSNVTITSSKMKSLVYWRDICSLLHTKRNLQELELCNSDLDDTSERVLCKALRHPSCQLHTLKLTYFSVGSTFEDVFKAVVHNQHLTFLSLSCMPISLKVFSLLHEVLANPMCSIQHLSLMKCDLKASAYEEIASLLISSRKLKKLTLSKNPLNDHRVKILCDALLHPDCALESLVLLFCCITKSCCNVLARTLMISETLKHLDLSVNYLQNDGVMLLILPLVFTTCTLQELELSGCFFTGDACRQIAFALKSNPNLKSLELGSNHIGDAGMELLCDSLTHPNCKLENIGLEECMLTSACCASLASVLIGSRTLRKLNLLGNKLGDEGIVQLLEGLGHPDCVLETVGRAHT